MTDAQKALDELPIPVHIRLRLGASSGTIVHWYDEHEKTIHRALRLLAAVEAGTHKVVPVNSVRCKECDDTQRRSDNGEICNCIF